MAQVEEAIEVRVPVRTAYDQWTQFEEFPQFMEGVEQVRQLDDSTMHWVAQIAGQRREWDAKITQQVPDQRVEWTSMSGERNAGAVTFQQIDADRTRVVLQLDYEPEGTLEKAGDALGMVERRAKGDLERFRDFIETRGAESGAWRGEIRGGEPVNRDETPTASATQEPYGEGLDDGFPPEGTGSGRTQP
jgi:uncharacterized membrane protein